jgi:hypothetical protein
MHFAIEYARVLYGRSVDDISLSLCFCLVLRRQQPRYLQLHLEPTITTIAHGAARIVLDYDFLDQCFKQWRLGSTKSHSIYKFLLDNVIIADLLLKLSCFVGSSTCPPFKSTNLFVVNKRVESPDRHDEPSLWNRRALFTAPKSV